MIIRVKGEKRDIMGNGLTEVDGGYYFEDFYYSKDCQLMKTEGIEGIMINYVEDFLILHRQYNKQIEDVNYVPVGSVLGCTYGSILAKLDAKTAPAVYVGNGAAVLTCADCEAGTNIPTFGTCSCSKATRNSLNLPETKMGYWGVAEGPSGMPYIPYGYKCVPMVAGEWTQPGENTVMIWQSVNKDYSYALKDNAILVCLYGGIIGVVQVNNSIGREITFPDTIEGTLNGKKISLHPNSDWFAFMGVGDGVQKDSSRKYHLINVGPRILDPDYPDSGRLWPSDFGASTINTRINVVVKDEVTGKEITLECIATNLKAHTYNLYPDTKVGHKHKLFSRNKNITAKFNIKSGLIQTGIAYPNSSNGQKDSDTDGPIALDHIDGSSIEFKGKVSDLKRGGKDEKNYTLVKIIVCN